MVSSSQASVEPSVDYPSSPSNSTEELAERGWRSVKTCLPDGSWEDRLIPLTEEEFLHPEEGYHLPNSTFHDRMVADARAMLGCYYANHPTVGVFSDLIVEWDIPELGKHCPDVFVALNMQNPTINRHRLIVDREKTRPCWILEVVSPRYRSADRQTKVLEYARAQVQEYAIVDRRKHQDRWIEEVIGYRLEGEVYQPITPDDRGRIRFETLGLWMSMQDGQLVMEEIASGQRLKTTLELNAENQQLTAEKQELLRLLDRYRQQFGEINPNSTP